jgi:4-hydroxybenzoyl-CoA thioesterase
VLFSHTHTLTVEFGDCDPAGIVFYPRFFAMFDSATAFMLEAASGMTRHALMRHHQITGWPMVDTRAVFHRPITFDDKVRIDARVVGIGRSSLSIEHSLWLEEVLCVECWEKRVWASRIPGERRLQSIPIPDELRQQLSKPR